MPRTESVKQCRDKNTADGNDQGDANADEPEQEVEFACLCIQLGILSLELTFELAFEAMDEISRGHYFDKLCEHMRILTLEAGACQDVVKLCPITGQVRLLNGSLASGQVSGSLPAVTGLRSVHIHKFHLLGSSPCDSLVACTNCGPKPRSQVPSML